MFHTHFQEKKNPALRRLFINRDQSISFDLADFRIDGNVLRFRSALTTSQPNNNIVSVKITPALNNRSHAVILFHHWNARTRQSILSKILSLFGLTIFEISLPYHFDRSDPEKDFSEDMLSCDVQKTIHSFDQATSDAIKLISYLNNNKYDTISVLGFSLGSWVAGIVAALDESVTKAALYLGPGSLADMVWSGSATRHIRESLVHNMSPDDLNAYWSPMNLENYSGMLARSDLKIQVGIATHDKVVPIEITRSLSARLIESKANFKSVKYNCGHYSFSLPPNSMIALYQIVKFLACK